MTISYSNATIEQTIPDSEQYPMMRSLVDDLERYINPQQNTPKRHSQVEPANRFYVVEDHVYVGESIAHELAARRQTPLLTLDDCDSYPEAITGTNTESCSLAQFLAESSHREVTVCISDITTLPDNSFEMLLDILSTTTYTTDSTEVTGNPDNLLLITSEPSDEILPDLSPTQRSQFGVRINPDKHDGYTDDAFDRL